MKLPDGSEVPCLVLHPVIDTKGMFSKRSDTRIWLTDDERRLPVQIRSKFPFGTITLRLKDMVVPAGAATFAEGLRVGTEVFHALKGILKGRGLNTAVGDEGGFAPDLDSNRDALGALVDGIEAAGYEAGKDVFIALDPATTELFEEGRYLMPGEGRELDPEGMIGFWEALCARFPIVSIEDGLAEDDWGAWQALTAQIGAGVQLVGDDLYVTNTTRLARGIAERSGNAILVKLNQIGTLTESFEAIELAQRAGFNTVI